MFFKIQLHTLIFLIESRAASPTAPHPPTEKKHFENPQRKTDHKKEKKIQETRID